MKGNTGVILLGVVLTLLLAALDQTIVATALPQIVGEFNGLAHLSWVYTAYMLASTVSLPIYGKLSDMYGRRGLYILGIVIFLAGSVLSGMSQSMLQLILFRGLQGIGGGAMMVNSIAMIGEVFPPAERGKWQGLLGGVFGLASVAGPLLGGWITDVFSWRWIFFVNLPFGLLAIAVLLAAIPRLPEADQERPIDLLGAGLITLGLVPLLLALVWGGSEYPWWSWPIVSCLGAAAVSLALFAAVERRTAEPIMKLDLFRNSVFAASALATFLAGSSMFGTILFIPLFAQGVTGISATSSGLVLAPMMIALIASSTVGGQIVSRTGNYKIVAVSGMAIAALGMSLFTTIGVATTRNGLYLRMIVLGLGLGLTMPVFTIAVQNAFARKRLGEVTAALQLFRSIGGTVGTTVLGGVMNSALAGRLEAIRQESFVVSAGHLGDLNPLAHVDSNTIQALLSPAGQARMHALIDRAPLFMHEALAESFNHLLYTIRLAFSAAVDRQFLVCTLFMAAALFAVIFLPQLPLRRAEDSAPFIGEKPGTDRMMIADLRE